jgi:hypothetical protein
MAITRMRSYTRPWVITCDNGSFTTYSMKRNDADQVALWCDKEHPDCRPHIVQSREKRTWAERQANNEQ